MLFNLTAPVPATLWSSLALVTLGLLLARMTVRHVRREIKIREYGGHAPRFRGWLPFGTTISVVVRSHLEPLPLTINTGLSFLVQFRSSVSADDCLKFCNNTFVRICKARENPYTIEATVAGQRIIFTADPENVKAILATQFWDFEKGEKFRNDWVDMLGHSMSSFLASDQSRCYLNPVADKRMGIRHFQFGWPSMARCSSTSPTRL